MSAGKVHQRASLLLAATFATLAVYQRDYTYMITAAGALTGVIVSPDLDVDKAFIGDEIIARNLGQFVGKLWKWFWQPYKTSYKHGRFMSHFPVYSTIVRMSYVFFWAIAFPYLIYCVTIHASPMKLFELLPQYYNPHFTFGLIYSDTIHYFLDILTTEHKNEKVNLGGNYGSGNKN